MVTCIQAPTAVEHIDTVATGHDVIAIATVEAVDASFSKKIIVSGVTDQVVVAIASVNGVALRTTNQDIVF